MSALEKLKLSKQLQIAMTNAGYLNAREIQSKLLPRIHGGQNIIAIGPDGSGKTTTYILAALNKLQFTEDIAPRVLVLVPDIESGEKVLDQFNVLNRNRNLRIVTLFAGGTSMDTQVLLLTDGVDIVIATPDRARAVYLKLGLNLNKIQHFIVDDADLILKKGLQLPVVELARGIRKSQFLVFSSVYHQKLEDLTANFMEDPVIVEVEDLGKTQLKTTDQLLYLVPNFKTKLNLLNLLMRDEEVFDKVLVFVNSTFTAETVFKNLQTTAKDIAYYKAESLDEESFDSLTTFKQTPKSRILIIVNEELTDTETHQFANIIHFDIPDTPLLYLQRVIINKQSETDQLALTFCTDLELTEVRKLEQAQGKKMQVIDLPDDLYIEEDQKRKPTKNSKSDDEASTKGAAFHDKKPSNLKTHNYSAREKIRLSGKISNKRHD